MRTNRRKRRAATGILLCLAMTLVGLLTFLPAANAQDSPVITIKYDGQVVSNPQIDVEAGKKLEFLIDFGNMAKGSEYVIQLPAVFTDLNKATIEATNGPILQYVELAIEKNAGGQSVTITFKENAISSSFSFWALLNFEQTDIGQEKEIVIDGETTLTIVPKQPGGGEGGTGPSKPPKPWPTADGEFFKGTEDDTVTETQFMESTDPRNALNFIFALNASLLNKTMTATMKDELPQGIKLFVPSAPNYASNGYEDAIESLTIGFYDTLIKKDGSVYYLDTTANKADYVALVNRIEIKQGRPGGYTIEDIADRMIMPDHMVAALKNADGKMATFDRVSVGYRIDTSGTIHLTPIDTSMTDVCEQEHSGPWTDDSKFIPLYDSADGSSTSIYWESLVTAVYIQGYDQIQPPQNGVTRVRTGPFTDGTKTTYTWTYTLMEKESFTISITYDSATGRDILELAMAVDDQNPLYGKAMYVAAAVYFDQDQWAIPSDGKITFTNTAVYNQIEKSAQVTYNYDFGSMGTVVAGAGKTVEGADKTHINPEGETARQYELTFTKLGSGAIAAGQFNTFDQLDANLDFVEGSLDIQIKKNGTNWESIRTAQTATSATAGGAEKVNLNVRYDSASHRVILTNAGVGELDYSGQMKVIFEAKLKDAAKYGVKVINYFGETVDSFVNHKLAVHKVDGSGSAILSDKTRFTLQVTTDDDYENATLANLVDENGQTITAIAAAANGVAQTLYRQEADVFYLKLTETVAPDGYTPLAGSIWIKAVRQEQTREMTYTLAKAPEGVIIQVAADGLVTVKVPNEAAVVTPDPINFTLKATKTVTGGKALTNQQFSFAVKIRGTENVVATGKNAADGSITFEPIEYTEAGVHYYTVVETSVDGGGWTVDRTAYDVTVTVVNTGGVLSASADKTAAQLTFNNAFTPDKVSISLEATKTVTGGKALTNQQFGFAVKIRGTENVVATGKNAADGSITFEPIEYTQAGTHYYTVVETSVDGGGWTTDRTAYDVTVTVVNTDGVLSVSANKTAVQLTFNNTFTPDPITFALGATKTVTGGKALADQQFSFAVKVKDTETVVATGKNDADGSVTFEPIEYTEAGTYHYTVVETSVDGGGWTTDRTVYDVTVTVVNNNGVLSASANKLPAQLTFNNIFTPAPITFALGATKTVTGGKALADQQFSFAVKIKDTETVAATGKNDAGGSVAFESIEYTQAGVYEYTVVETSINGGGWTVDKTAYDVTVTVVNNNGVLSASADKTAAQLTFNNAYAVASTDIVLQATKRAQGATLAAGQFRFAVREGDTTVVAGTNDASGLITFDKITYTEAGVHHYTIVETSTDGNGWTVDTAAHAVTVTVTDNGDGTLTASTPSAATDIVFTNTYHPGSASLQLEAVKTAIGHPLIDGQFRFVVLEGNQIVASGTNTAAGTILFTPIQYTAAGTHTYTVKEITPGNVLWSVDGTVHTVTVTVADNGDGTLSAAPQYPAGGVAFVNRYTEPEEPSDERVSLRIRKELLDEDGTPDGAGKKFAVRLYDEHMNLIRRIILTANEGDVVVTGLNSGTTYYLMEETGDGFELLEYEIVGVGKSAKGAVGMRVPAIGGAAIEIQVVVRNTILSLTDIPEEDPPLSPADPPDEEDTDLIDIPDPEPPLNPPGTGVDVPALLLPALLAAAAAATLLYRKRRLMDR